MAHRLHYKLCRQSIAVMEEAGYGKAARELYAGLMGFLSTPMNLTAPVLYSMAVLEGITSSVTGRKPTLGKIIRDKSLQLPKNFDDAIKKLWGFASNRVRHFSDGSPITDQAEAKLIFSISCATCIFLLRKNKASKKDEKEHKTWLQLKNYGYNDAYAYRGKIGELVGGLSTEFEIPDEIGAGIVDNDRVNIETLATVYKSVVEMYSLNSSATDNVTQAAKILEDSALVLLASEGKIPERVDDRLFLSNLGIPAPLDESVSNIYTIAKNTRKETDELELIISMSCAVSLFLLAPFVDS